MNEIQHSLLQFNMTYIVHVYKLSILSTPKIEQNSQYKIANYYPHLSLAHQTSETAVSKHNNNNNNWSLILH